MQKKKGNGETMTNLQRLKLEINLNGAYTDEQLTVFLLENDLTDTDGYNPSSNTNKKNILKTALSILEAIANNPQLMKSYKSEDISVTEFSENLQNRIDQL
jgi:RNase H-fold protein (predicted Holliday junction resolvase)